MLYSRDAAKTSKIPAILWDRLSFMARILRKHRDYKQKQEESRSRDQRLEPLELKSKGVGSVLWGTLIALHFLPLNKECSHRAPFISCGYIVFRPIWPIA